MQGRSARRAARWLGMLPAVVPAIVLAVMLGSASPAAGQEPEPGEAPPTTVAPTTVAPGVRAATAPVGLTSVGIDVFINEVLEIDERANTFKVNITLTAEWNDERAVPPDCKVAAPATVYDGEGAVERLKDNIWSPGFHVIEAVGPRETSSVAVSIVCNGTVRYKERFVTTVFWRYTGLHDFPYDDHRMTFSIAPFATSEFDNIRFHSLYDIAADQDFGSADWDSEEWDYSVRFADQRIDAEVPVLETVIEIDRKTRYYWLNIIGPLLLIVSISWTVFWMEANLAERLAVSITILLTVVAFDFLTSDNLPRLSYTTRLDQFYNVSYAIVAATVLVSIIVARRAKRADEQPPSERSDDGEEAASAPPVPSGSAESESRLDYYARRGFPVAYSVLVGASFIGLFSYGNQQPVIQTDALVAEEMEIDVAQELETLGDDDVLVLDGFVDGMIDEAGIANKYELCPTTSAVSLTMERRGGENDLLDPFLAVYAANGELVTADDDSAGGLDSLVTFDVKPGACYLVVAADLEQDTGAYRLRATAAEAVEAKVGLTNVTADFGLTLEDLRARSTALEIDDPVSATIDEPGEFDVYEVCQSTVGDEPLTVTMRRDSSSDELDPYLVVYTADGMFVDADDDRAGELDSLIEIDTAPDSCYFVIAQDLEPGIGAYKIEATSGAVDGASDLELHLGATFEELSADAEAAPYDDRVEGEIRNIDVPDFYGFCVAAGDEVEGGALQVVMKRTGEFESLDPAIWIYAADGSEVAFDDDSAGGLDSRAVLDPVDPGCYLVVAGELGGQTGTYELATIVG